MAKMTENLNQTDSIATLFSKGLYTAILQTYQKNPAAIPIESLHYVIGALSMLGQTLEAEELYKNKCDSFSALGLSFSLFYLGTGVTRKSRYKKARKIFKLNQSLHAENPDPAIAFYAYQGVAFYLYFNGQFFRSEKFATKAFKLAIQAGNPQIKFWAQDLLAYTLIKTGQVLKGLELLKEVHTVSETLGNEAFATATGVSILLCEAEYGYRPHEIIKDLTECLSSIQAQNSYSKSNVALELARQKTMRGQWHEADQLLNSQAPSIFASENRRQEITLNLHWAKLAFLRGQYVLAWQYLRSAQLRLHGEADRNFAIQILSIEVDILEEQKSPLAEQRRAQLIELSNSFSSTISRNMLARRNLLAGPHNSGDDPIHDVLEKISAQPLKAVKIVADSGYYSWFYKCLPLQRGRNYIVLGVEKNSLALISNEGIELNKFAGSSQRLLEILQKGPISKASLVEEVWGYEYHPLRHDNLVYSAMSTLRKSFGNKHHWIQTSDEGYQLSDEVTVLQANPGRVRVSAQIEEMPESKKVTTKGPVDTQLNYRQIQALDYLQENRFLNTREYKNLFQTTEITACRDLAALNKKGYVLKVGFGRSTHYTLPEGK